MTRWIPDDPAKEAEMLHSLGLPTIDALFEDIPKGVQISRMGIGPGRTESQVVGAIDKILARNKPISRFSNFLGGRISSRYLPAVVDAILSRSEFYTSYTPYQPEASQGMLQALFEFQSLWVELTGLDVANASLYDGATAAGEAMLLCRRIHLGDRFLLPASLPWEEKSVLANYGAGLGLKLAEIPFDPSTGRLDLEWVDREVRVGDVFGVLADVPNGFGLVDERLLDLKGTVGTVPLVVSADPLSLTVLQPPGEYGADIVVGEGQGFGMAPSFGGPLLGLMACRHEHVRLMPGRLVGATQDVHGRRAYALTLQTREQHIRRSRATSNICTNESLLALAFVVYATSVGPARLARLQTDLAEKAHELAASLAGIDGLTVPRFNAPYLGEFAMELTQGNATGFLDRMLAKGILAGHSLSDPRPAARSGPELVLVAPSQSTRARDSRKYVTAAREALRPVSVGAV
ncbi:MAG: aminomethyl-transferring glycine dehydrogenase subunit GcvPA [Thermoplasmata archaeon]